MHETGQKLTQFLEQYHAFMEHYETSSLEYYGTLDRIQGLMIEAHGLFLPIDTCVEILGEEPIKAQVISFSENSTFLIPFEGTQNLYPSARIRPCYLFPSRPQISQGSENKNFMEKAHTKIPYLGKSFPFSPHLLGRVVNAWGEVIDHKEKIQDYEYLSRKKQHRNPLEKEKIKDILDVGIRSINGLLTIAKGQRMGIFSFAGVGKSVLIGMMTKNAKADVIIVALIGERGREVKEFIEDILGDYDLKHSIVIAATADESALLRVRAAEYANFLAEEYRSRGYDVLLVMDSLTRYAQARREIAINTGELPTMKGYPASTYVHIASLIERAGTGKTGEGSITAFYTVLVETDEDPIADTAKAILDGHIILSQALANRGHYPAIDISQSISRTLHLTCSAQDIQRINRFKELWSLYQNAQDMINIGAYLSGSDPELDTAILAYPKLCDYLKQRMDESCHYKKAHDQITDLEKQFSKRTLNT